MINLWQIAIDCRPDWLLYAAELFLSQWIHQSGGLCNLAADFVDCQRLLRNLRIVSRLVRDSRKLRVVTASI